jgi:hypothetical protein
MDSGSTRYASKCWNREASILLPAHPPNHDRPTTLPCSPATQTHFLATPDQLTSPPLSQLRLLTSAARRLPRTQSAPLKLADHQPTFPG